MPLQWNGKHNPYVFNAFSILGVGPGTTPNQVGQVAKQVTRCVEAGYPPDLAGEKLDAHQVSEAVSALLDDRKRAAELLLVHPPVRQEPNRLKAVSAELRTAATLPVAYEPLPLRHPLGLFWFLPAPEPEASDWPELSEFRLVAPGEPLDRDLDIVFDL
jgi:hypothetical protein